VQAVAVAAGLAYPAWRCIAKIPAPVLLLGAGVALGEVGARSAKAMSGDQGGEQLTDKVRRTVQDASTQVADRFDSVKERAAAAASEATATVSSRVSELSERAGAVINDATASARHTAAESLAAARDTLSGTYQAGAQAAAHTGEQLTQSKETLIQMMENHLFVVGGIGLLVGAVIASALPVSQAENRLFGDNSEHLKNRARDLAAEGVNVAAAAAQSVYQESVSRVQEQGLSSASVREIVKDVGDKVKDVVQQATDALAKDDNASPVFAVSQPSASRRTS
jgi:gas vesicle protein